MKYFQSEVFELNEAILNYNSGGILENVIAGITQAVGQIIGNEPKDYKKEHIKEELADVMVMLKQFQLYYNISTKEIKEVMKYKVDRQIERIEYEPKHGKVE